MVESSYKDTKGEDRKCYLLGKTECRAIAATESKSVCYMIMVYLDQLEQIFEKAKEAKLPSSTVSYQSKVLHGEKPVEL